MTKTTWFDSDSTRSRHKMTRTRLDSKNGLTRPALVDIAGIEPNSRTERNSWESVRSHRDGIPGIECSWFRWRYWFSNFQHRGIWWLLLMRPLSKVETGHGCLLLDIEMMKKVNLSLLHENSVYEYFLIYTLKLKQSLSSEKRRCFYAFSYKYIS